MKVYVLIENTKPFESAYLSEHGLCMYFEHNGKHILYDTGASDKFIYNATLMGIDLAKVDMCVLSHGHYDHTGGLRYFLDINKKAQVYMKRSACRELYSRKLLRYRYTGMDKKFVENYSGRIKYIEEDTVITKGVALATINKYRNFPKYTTSMYYLQDEQMVNDDLAHELFINVKTQKGNVVLTGCSHHGLINVLKTAEEKFGKVYGVAGGFHLNGTKLFGIRMRKESKHEIRTIAKYFEKKGIKKIYTGHCTGEKPYERLKLLSRTKKLQSGDILKF